MGVRIDTSRDHDSLAEAPETILYNSKTVEKPDPEGQWVRVPNCEVFPIDKRRLQADSLLSKFDMTCRGAKTDFGGIVPKIEDIWQRAKDGTYWVVKMVDVVSFGNEYRLHNVKSTKR